MYGRIFFGKQQKCTFLNYFMKYFHFLSDINSTL